ncbi:Txe/YoeB family addiction module toxin [Duganella sp. FT135W]|uniref:Txe/YoeB family addiction module toxin n=1 Tax=Duganella flavida TaxID=2692175 RepID=A0A6L8K8A4_9BURK|nr:Txe/YoeB family addiction module toxin [Duganella flavida]
MTPCWSPPKIGLPYRKPCICSRYQVCANRSLLPTRPPFEKLVGDLAGTYSRRINIHHRLVYEVFPDQKIVRILRMWTHYD